MQIVRCAAVVFVLTLVWIADTCAQRSSFPAVITDIQARLVEVRRFPAGTTRSTPAQVVAWTSTYIFELVFQVEPADMSFWYFVPFDVVGHLPNGEIIQRSITIDSCSISAEGRSVSFVLRMESRISGSARFILTTWQAERHLEFYDYAIRTDQRTVYIDCSSRQ